MALGGPRRARALRLFSKGVFEGVVDLHWARTVRVEEVDLPGQHGAERVGVECVHLTQPMAIKERADGLRRRPMMTEWHLAEQMMSKMRVANVVVEVVDDRPVVGINSADSTLEPVPDLRSHVRECRVGVVDECVTNQPGLRHEEREDVELESDHAVSGEDECCEGSDEGGDAESAEKDLPADLVVREEGVLLAPIEVVGAGSLPMRSTGNVEDDVEGPAEKEEQTAHDSDVQPPRKIAVHPATGGESWIAENIIERVRNVRLTVLGVVRAGVVDVVGVLPGEVWDHQILMQNIADDVIQWLKRSESTVAGLVAEHPQSSSHCTMHSSERHPRDRVIEQPPTTVENILTEPQESQVQREVVGDPEEWSDVLLLEALLRNGRLQFFY